jgi:hypothetical protein
VTTKSPARAGCRPSVLPVCRRSFRWILIAELAVAVRLVHKKSLSHPLSNTSHSSTYVQMLLSTPIYSLNGTDSLPTIVAFDPPITCSFQTMRCEPPAVMGSSSEF